MKIFLNILLILSLSSCSTVDLRYEGKIKVENKGEGRFIYTKNHTNGKGLYYSCWLTFIFAGGTCWLYMLKPDGDQIEATKAAAKSKLDHIHGEGKWSLVPLNDFKYEIFEIDGWPSIGQNEIGKDDFVIIDENILSDKEQSDRDQRRKEATKRAEQEERDALKRLKDAEIRAEKIRKERELNKYSDCINIEDDSMSTSYTLDFKCIRPKSKSGQDEAFPRITTDKKGNKSSDYYIYILGRFSDWRFLKTITYFDNKTLKGPYSLIKISDDVRLGNGVIEHRAYSFGRSDFERFSKSGLQIMVTGNQGYAGEKIFIEPKYFQEILKAHENYNPIKI